MQICDFTISEIASYLILQFNALKLNYSYWKLQKMLYYVYAFVLVKRQQKLFDSTLIASEVGPVFSELEIIYKQLPINYVFTLNKEIKMIIDDVVNNLGKYTTYQLELLSYQDKPWQNANLGEVITDGELYEYFSMYV